MGIEGFDSLEEMFARMEEDRLDADSRVQHWQAALSKGDYFLRDAGVGIPIYGEILHNAPKTPTLQHYRRSRCYSIYCPQGEMGDIHVSTVRRVLSEEEFNAAKQQGWRR